MRIISRPMVPALLVLLLALPACATAGQVLQELDTLTQRPTGAPPPVAEKPSVSPTRDSGPLSFSSSALSPEEFQQALNAISDRLVAAKVVYCPLEPKGILTATFGDPANWESKSAYETDNEYTERFGEFFLGYAQSVVRDLNLADQVLIYRGEFPVETRRSNESLEYDLQTHDLGGTIPLFEYNRTYPDVKGGVSAAVPILQLSARGGDKVLNEGLSLVVDETSGADRDRMVIKVGVYRHAREAHLDLSLIVPRAQAQRIGLLENPLTVEVQTRLNPVMETPATGCSIPMAELQVESVRLLSNGASIYETQAETSHLEVNNSLDNDLEEKISKHFPGWRLSTEREIAARTSQALHGADAQTLWTQEWLDHEVSWGSGKTWWVWRADFDTDGKEDLATILTNADDPARDRLVVLHSDGSVATVPALLPGGRLGGKGVMVVPPGKRTIEGRDVTLSQPALALINWESGVIYLTWQDGDYGLLKP